MGLLALLLLPACSRELGTTRNQESDQVSGHATKRLSAEEAEIDELRSLIPARGGSSEIQSARNGPVLGLAVDSLVSDSKGAILFFPITAVDEVAAIETVCERIRRIIGVEALLLTLEALHANDQFLTLLCTPQELQRNGAIAEEHWNKLMIAAVPDFARQKPAHHAHSAAEAFGSPSGRPQTALRFEDLLIPSTESYGDPDQVAEIYTQIHEGDIQRSWACATDIVNNLLFLINKLGDCFLVASDGRVFLGADPLELSGETRAPSRSKQPISGELHDYRVFVDLDSIEKYALLVSQVNQAMMAVITRQDQLIAMRLWDLGVESGRASRPTRTSDNLQEASQPPEAILSERSESKGLMSIDQWCNAVGYMAPYPLMSEKAAFYQAVGTPTKSYESSSLVILTWECSDGSVLVELSATHYNVLGYLLSQDVSFIRN